MAGDDEYEQTLEPRVHASSLMAILRHNPTGLSVKRPVSRLRAANPVGANLLWEGLRAELDKMRAS